MMEARSWCTSKVGMEDTMSGSRWIHQDCSLCTADQGSTSMCLVISDIVEYTVVSACLVVKYFLLVFTTLLQSLSTYFRRFSTGPVTETPAGPSSSTGPPPPPVSASPTLYTAGEEVLALWKQNRKFPAIIQTIQEDGGYLVK